MIGKIILKNCFHKPLNTLISILLFTIGIGITSLIIQVEFQLKQQINSNLEDVDMVVGAKGSPLQLVLSAVYQVDNPTGNIPLKEIEKLSKHPYIEKIIPISMGDYYKDAKIVGTTVDYLAKYHAKIETGRLNKQPLEIVIGKNMANLYQLNVGMSLISSHGNSQDTAHEHSEQHYTITGILKPTQSVLDNIAITSNESIWKIHHHEEHNESSINEEKYITAALIKFRSPMGIMIMPNWINQNTKLQAAIPIIEINKVLDIFGIGINILKWIAFAIIGVALISIFFRMITNLQERKFEIALMRSLGASKFFLFLTLTIETLFYCSIGIILGLLFSRIFLTYLNTTQLTYHSVNFTHLSIKKDEVIIFSCVIGLCLLSAIFPINKVYRLNISKTLNEN